MGGMCASTVGGCRSNNLLELLPALTIGGVSEAGVSTGTPLSQHRYLHNFGATLDLWRGSLLP
ncbi:hypothetical protein METHPM2_200002 [Pseudomonas sp. PM2]